MGRTRCTSLRGQDLGEQSCPWWPGQQGRSRWGPEFGAYCCRDRPALARWLTVAPSCDLRSDSLTRLWLGEGPAGGPGRALLDLGLHRLLSPASTSLRPAPPLLSHLSPLLHVTHRFTLLTRAETLPTTSRPRETQGAGQGRPTCMLQPDWGSRGSEAAWPEHLSAWGQHLGTVGSPLGRRDAGLQKVGCSTPLWLPKSSPSRICQEMVETRGPARVGGFICYI